MRKEEEARAGMVDDCWGLPLHPVPSPIPYLRPLLHDRHADVAARRVLFRPLAQAQGGSQARGAAPHDDDVEGEDLAGWERGW